MVRLFLSEILIQITTAAVSSYPSSALNQTDEDINLK